MINIQYYRGNDKFNCYSKLVNDRLETNNVGNRYNILPADFVKEPLVLVYRVICFPPM